MTDDELEHMTDSEGNQLYLYDGCKVHRTNGPAIIENDGSEYWFKMDRRHRDDGPAIIMRYRKEAGGGVFRKEWWYEGQKHRLDGPAVEDFHTGTIKWFVAGYEIPDDEAAEWCSSISMPITPEVILEIKMRWHS